VHSSIDRWDGSTGEWIKRCRWSHRDDDDDDDDDDDARGATDDDDDVDVSSSNARGAPRVVVGR